MKRFRKVLLALTALLGVVIAGGIWLANSAFNVMSDAVDSTLDSAHRVQTVAQKEVVGAAQSAQNSAASALSGAEHSLVAPDKPASVTRNTSTVPSTNKTPDTAQDKIADSETGKPPKPATKKGNKDAEDSVADFGGLLNLFLNDGEDDADPTALLTSGDKDANDEKSGSKNTEDALTNMIPGANSPTVKKWMDGKYKGKESQAIDDAIEDPKIWRLVFFLSGGL